MCVKNFIACEYDEMLEKIGIKTAIYSFHSRKK